LGLAKIQLRLNVISYTTYYSNLLSILKRMISYIHVPGLRQ